MIASTRPDSLRLKTPHAITAKHLSPPSPFRCVNLSSIPTGLSPKKIHLPCHIASNLFAVSAGPSTPTRSTLPIPTKSPYPLPRYTTSGSNSPDHRFPYPARQPPPLLPTHKENFLAKLTNPHHTISNLSVALAGSFAPKNTFFSVAFIGLTPKNTLPPLHSPAFPVLEESTHPFPRLIVPFTPTRSTFPARQNLPIPRLAAPHLAAIHPITDSLTLPDNLPRFSPAHKKNFLTKLTNPHHA